MHIDWLVRPARRRCRHPVVPLLVLLLLAIAGPVEAAEALRYGQGLLWRIETPRAAPSHLFGTMHSTDEGVLELPGEVAEAFTRADSVSLELVMTPEVQQRTAEAMVLADGRSLDAILGPERFRDAAAIGRRYGFEAAQLRVFKPWALMTVFSIAPAEFARNAAGALPLDQVMQAEAVRRGVPVHGLETIDEQLAVFDAMPEADQLTFLDLVIAEHPRIEWWFEETKRYYLAGDVAAVKNLMKQQAAGTDPELLQAFEERLIEVRNERMATRMVPRLEEGNAFVAVGALHLPGERGVLRLLERRGYRVSRVY